MATITKTYGLTLNVNNTPSTVIPVVDFSTLLTDYPVADYDTAILLESFRLNLHLKSFNLQVLPEFDGSETEGQKLAKYNAAELKSQKVGLRVLTKKSVASVWRRDYEHVLTNTGRSTQEDLMPFLSPLTPARAYEINDQLAVQLIDYGNGLLKTDDYIEITISASVRAEKKNNDLEELQARLASLELALEGKLTDLPANTLLGRNLTSGTVQAIAQSTFATPAQVDAALLNLIGAAPANLNTLDELAQALNDDANFSATVVNQLAGKANKSFTSSLEEQSATITTPLNIAAGGVLNVGSFVVGHASNESVFVFSVYIQYGDGTNTYGHWQMHGTGLISSIQWKAGGTALWTSFNMESHNGNDFSCQCRFSSSNANRSFQFSPSVAIVTQAPSILRVRLKRIFGP